jgi:hypothetical protein
VANPKMARRERIKEQHRKYAEQPPPEERVVPVDVQAKSKPESKKQLKREKLIKKLNKVTQR